MKKRSEILDSVLGDSLPYLQAEIERELDKLKNYLNDSIIGSEVDSYTLAKMEEIEKIHHCRILHSCNQFDCHRFYYRIGAEPFHYQKPQF